ncbi:hypothetical protein P1J78_18180 [Psychromarinibacter sp. C21-152]|uniref:Uncharacterized protein n=1 Tax=Psychromarinibacter sediminicola TaxID=3033385 RepID=A0AAE3NV98_9RHOB|nr:hypothetical protein [Psychromarinibacter sediminicola]MDF0602671.1 hypothetical protein [Psychromarinibacter sediminicola]
MRRRALLAGGLGAVAAAVALPLVTRRIEDELRRILRDGFGDKIAGNPEAAVFIVDVAAIWNDTTPPAQRITKPTTWMLSPLLPGPRAERAGLEEAVIRTFLRATNAVRAHETGEPLVYLGMPDPYARPCANPLSAMWL